jgi:glycosyltransferase involved in cell wall biosynthesis
MRVLNLVPSADSVCFRQQVDVLERKGVDCRTLAVSEHGKGGSSRSPETYVRFVARAIQEAAGDHDIVHANYGLVAPIAVAQPTRPVVVTFWGSDLMNEENWLPVVSRAVGRFADAAILPSEAMAPYFPHPYHHVPFGVDMDQFRPIPRAEARATVGWKSDRPIVLFPYTKERDVKNYPRAERVVERAAVDADLRWITGVDHDEMPLYMNASDAVLVTSNRESGPMVVKEAAACNVPVVSTDVGFARDVLEPVQHSAVCTTDAELVAALEAILTAGERSDGREWVESWSLDEMAERILDLYETLLDDRVG